MVQHLNQFKQHAHDLEKNHPEGVRLLKRKITLTLMGFFVVVMNFMMKRDIMKKVILKTK